MNLRVGLICIQIALAFSTATAQLAFDTIEIDPHIGDVCYAVDKADVDGDGKMDIVAISESMAVWYRNPDWKKFIIIDGVLPRDHVCIAPHDIDRDGKIDFAIGAGWPNNGGAIYWLRRNDSLEVPWQIHEIGAEAWTHRMRFADVLGSGERQLVVSPLNRTTGQGVRLLVFEIPDDPTKDQWKPIVADGSLNRLHNHLHVQLLDAEASETLTASQEGLSLLQRNTNGGFALQRLTAGAQPPSETTDQTGAQSGAGEIKATRLDDQTWLLASIEPMHGNQVVVYQAKTEEAIKIEDRVVLTDSFNQGHGLAIADLTGNLLPEIVAGFRQSRTDQSLAKDQATGPQSPGPGIVIFQADGRSLKKWTPFPLDLENMACEDLLCHDFNDDGKIDVVAGGRASHNVRLYLNKSTPQ